MDLSNLKPAKGATRKRKRIGRGQGSGYGGTATRGHKGQRSRSGSKIPAWFEGGQMPLSRRIPKFGFTNPNRVAYKAVNVSKLARLVEEGRLDASQPVTPEVLASLGLVQKENRVKVLGNGEIDIALRVEAHGFSASAKEKIEKAGGETTIIN